MCIRSQPKRKNAGDLLSVGANYSTSCVFESAVICLGHKMLFLILTSACVGEGYDGAKEQRAPL